MAVKDDPHQSFRTENAQAEKVYREQTTPIRRKA